MEESLSPQLIQNRHTLQPTNNPITERSSWHLGLGSYNCVSLILILITF